MISLSCLYQCFSKCALKIPLDTLSGVTPVYHKWLPSALFAHPSFLQLLFVVPVPFSYPIWQWVGAVLPHTNAGALRGLFNSAHSLTTSLIISFRALEVEKFENCYATLLLAKHETTIVPHHHLLHRCLLPPLPPPCHLLQVVLLSLLSIFPLLLQ